MCKQRPNETDREFLTRWCTMRNSCEGIIESQEITWFAQGCRHGSVLWQRLQRDMPASLAETIRIADSYALGDPTQPLLMSADGMTETQIYDAAGSQRCQERSEYRSKRRDERPDYRYGSAQVAAVSQDYPDAGSSQRQRTSGKQQWVPKNDGTKPCEQRNHYQDQQKYTYDIAPPVLCPAPSP